MLFILGVILCVGLIVGGIVLLADWQTHKEMTMGYSNQHGYAGFETFKREFDRASKTNGWIHNEVWLNSLFNYETNSKFHANIICFEGRGMVMKDPFSLMQAKSYVKQYIKYNHSKNTVNW